MTNKERFYKIHPMAQDFFWMTLFYYNSKAYRQCRSRDGQFFLDKKGVLQYSSFNFTKPSNVSFMKMLKRDYEYKLRVYEKNDFGYKQGLIIKDLYNSLCELFDKHREFNNEWTELDKEIKWSKKNEPEKWINKNTKEKHGSKI